MSLLDFSTNLIRKITGKTLEYNDRFVGPQEDVWFLNATLGGEFFKVIKFFNDGTIECYKDDQKKPTKIDKLLSREKVVTENAVTTIVKNWKRSISDPSHQMCRDRLMREFNNEKEIF